MFQHRDQHSTQIANDGFHLAPAELQPHPSHTSLVPIRTTDATRDRGAPPLSPPPLGSRPTRARSRGAFGAEGWQRPAVRPSSPPLPQVALQPRNGAAAAERSASRIDSAAGERASEPPGPDGRCGEPAQSARRSATPGSRSSSSLGVVLRGAAPGVHTVLRTRSGVPILSSHFSASPLSLAMPPIFRIGSQIPSPPQLRLRRIPAPDGGTDSAHPSRNDLRRAAPPYAQRPARLRQSVPLRRAATHAPGHASGRAFGFCRRLAVIVRVEQIGRYRGKATIAVADIRRFDDPPAEWRIHFGGGAASRLVEEAPPGQTVGTLDQGLRRAE